MKTNLSVSAAAAAAFLVAASCSEQPKPAILDDFIPEVDCQGVNLLMIDGQPYLDSIEPVFFARAMNRVDINPSVYNEVLAAAQTNFIQAADMAEHAVQPYFEEDRPVRVLIERCSDALQESYPDAREGALSFPQDSDGPDI